MVNIITTGKKELDTFETLHKYIVLEVFKSHKVDKPSLDLVHKCNLFFNEEMIKFGGLSKFKVYPGPCYEGRLKKEFVNFKYHIYTVELPIQKVSATLFSLDSACKCNFIGVSLVAELLIGDPPVYSEVGGILMMKKIGTYQYVMREDTPLSFFISDMGTLINFKDQLTLLNGANKLKLCSMNKTIEHKDPTMYYSMPIAYDLMVLLYSLTDLRPSEDRLLLS